MEKNSFLRFYSSDERHLVVLLATELILYYSFFSSEERHLVVPLAAELFLYYYLYSNEIER